MSSTAAALTAAIFHRKGTCDARDPSDEGRRASGIRWDEVVNGRPDRRDVTPGRMPGVILVTDGPPPSSVTGGAVHALAALR